MPIPEDQLKAWAAQGPTAAAQSAFDEVRGVLLTDSRSLIHDAKTDLFMHGAYPNSTNRSGTEPVDVAVVLTSAWSQDLALAGSSAQDLRRLEGTCHEFRLDVLGTLRSKYGLVNVEDRPDCLRLEAAAGRLPVNLAVGIQHRLYLSFGATSGKQFQEGLCFWDPDGRQVAAFPKLHTDNGAAKDGQAGTNGWFKVAVRMFKGARDHLAEREVIDPSLAPSYFIECLLYNAPNQCFGWSCRDTFGALLKWLGAGQLAGLRAQSGIEPLFGSGPAQWSDQHARIFISTLTRAWNDWPASAPAQ